MNHWAQKKKKREKGREEDVTNGQKRRRTKTQSGKWMSWSGASHCTGPVISAAVGSGDLAWGPVSVRSWNLTLIGGNEGF